MTPTQAIAAIDRSLAVAGEDLTLRRRVGTSATFVALTVRAMVRGYTPEELVGGVKQTDSKVIMSPTQLAASADFPGDAGGSDYPAKGDFLVIDGKARQVEAVGLIRLGGEVVRIDLRILG